MFTFVWAIIFMWNLIDGTKIIVDEKQIDEKMYGLT